jgi:membrane-bound lytic murein transglycosylase A
MNKYLPIICAFGIIVGAFYVDKNRTLEEEDSYGRPLAIVLKAQTHQNGKLKKSKVFKSVYRNNNLDSIGFFPFIDANLMYMMRHQEEYLKKNKNQRYRIGKLSFSNKDLLSVINILKAYQYTFPVGLSSYFDFYQIKGQDSRGNVKFSAYYTPVVKASKVKTENFPYGIYKRPKEDAVPSYHEIMQGALEDKDLAIGYVADYQDIKKIKLEGSAILEFKDGSTKHIVFHSSSEGKEGSIKNNITKKIIKIQHQDNDTTSVSVSPPNETPNESEEILITEIIPEDSILIDHENLEQLTESDNVSDEEIVEAGIEEEDTIKEEEDEIKQGRYPFFMEVKKQKESSTGLPLVPWYSIAVDRKYVPLGSCLLAAAPIVDKKEKFKYHALQFVLAQDTGNKIKGAGRVDWYVGTGDKAAKVAQNIHHYGQLWLMLPKKKKSDKLSSTIKKSNKLIAKS